MNVEAQKLELIEWILQLTDASAIKKIKKMKDGSFKRKAKSGKQELCGAAEDFADTANNPAYRLDDITRKYSALNEKDLDTVEIYEQREHHHDRGIVFD